jgi:4-hydroxy-4-methyl-2-oxoglutarate aldolase
MPKYAIGPSPPEISGEVVALLERTEAATVGHWRHDAEHAA